MIQNNNNENNNLLVHWEKKTKIKYYYTTFDNIASNATTKSDNRVSYPFKHKPTNPHSNNSSVCGGAV